MRRNAVLVVSLAALSAGCGKSTLTPQGSQQVVVDAVFKATGFRPTDVRCPSGVEARVGVTFDCHFTGPDGPYTAHMRVTKIQGERVLYYVLSRPTGETLASVSRRTGFATQPPGGVGPGTVTPHSAEQVVINVVGYSGFRVRDVRCPGGVVARVGATFDCHFIGPDGPYTAQMRVSMVQGERVVFAVLSRRSD